MNVDTKRSLAPFNQTLTTLYSSLDQLLIRYKKGEIETGLIQDTLTFGDHFIELSKQHPDPLLAQLQFYKASYSYFVNLVFNQLLTTYLVAARNQWNDTAIQHLLCCVIAQFTGIATDLDKQAAGQLTDINRRKITQHNLPLLKHLNQLNWEIGFSGIRHAELRYHSNLERVLKRINNQSHLLGVLCLGSYLGFKLTRSKSAKTQSFADVIRTVARTLTCANYSLIEPLLTYPTLIPPGTLVTLHDDRHFLVLSPGSESFVGKTYFPDSRDCAAESEWIPLNDVKRVHSPQVVKALPEFEIWWNDPTTGSKHVNEAQKRANTNPHKLRPTLFKLDAPPPTLLAIQSHLYSEDLDANTLTELILAEPVFAMHIKTTATHSARENIVITDVKHGLLMHGFERANSILMEHALTLRLNQHYFPAQEQLLQFCHLYKHMVAAITKLRRQLTPELMACWAGFASSGLFTNASLKTKLNVSPKLERGPSLAHIVDTETPQLLPQHAIKLAQRWHQPNMLCLAIRTMDSLPANLTAPKQHEVIGFILGLGLILAKSTYWSTRYTLSAEDKQWIQHAPQLLGCDTFDPGEIVEQALSTAHCYSPI